MNAFRTVRELEPEGTGAAGPMGRALREEPCWCEMPAVAVSPASVQHGHLDGEALVRKELREERSF